MHAHQFIINTFHHVRARNRNQSPTSFLLCSRGLEVYSEIVLWWEACAMSAKSELLHQCLALHFRQREFQAA